jgi:CubicO group peptidase (beta-lactamase class C family)
MNKAFIRKSIVVSVIFILISVSVPSNYASTLKPIGLENSLEENTIFDNLIESLISLAHASAISVAIVKDNELLWSTGYGLYDRENNKAANDDTIYLVASISKTFTATAIMQLYEQGYFDLDDDVNDYLNFTLRNPNYPLDNITFRMLLAHQSSLATDLPTSFTRAVPGDIKIGGYPYPYLNELLVPGGIHYKPQYWTDFRPSDKMFYANVGFSILGHLVEIFTGKTLEEYCREHIFEPLDMKDTSFRLPNLNISRVAVPYRYSKEYYPFIHYQILDYPAGGLRTSVKDLSHFLLAHMNDGVYNSTQILTSQSVEEMHTIQYDSDTYDFQYGLGFQIWETSKGLKIGHTGGLYGVSTKMAYRKSDNIGIIMFINKAFSNIIDGFVFSLIEYLLFQKEKGLSTPEIRLLEVFENMWSNNLMYKDCKIDYQLIKTKFT